MIKVKANGTDTKEVLEGTIGMTVALTDESVNDLDGYWMYDAKVAYYIDFDCVELKKVYLHDFKIGDVEIDCDDKTYKNWVESVRKPYLINEALKRHHAECEKVTKGKVIKVVRGRKVPIGATGEVFWMGEVNYDPYIRSYHRSYHSSWRIGFKADNDETYWTDVRNVEVVDPSAYYEDEKVIAKINERLEKGEPLW